MTKYTGPSEHVKIVLDGEKPTSLNAFYSGMHHRKRTRLKDEQQLLVRAQIDPNIKPFDVPVKITFTVYYKTRAIRDIDNATVKMYIDGLKPFVIVDDDWRYVKSVEKIYEYDKENPRVEIVIGPWKTYSYYEMLDMFFPNIPLVQIPATKTDMDWARSVLEKEYGEATEDYLG